MVTNRIVTRGMGTSRGIAGRAGLITQGYGGPPPEVIVKALERVRINGKTHKDIDELVVWAKLLEVNNKATSKNIEGSVKINADDIVQPRVEAKKLTQRVVTDVIKVFIKRLK